jgi:dTDP-4-dehydrorhamnose reductase
VKRSVDVLIVGGDGLIGRALAEQLHAKNIDVAVTSRRNTTADYPVIPQDLAASLRKAELPNASCIVIAAAETSIARCEANPATTAVVNSEAPRQLARWAKDGGARILLLSTSAVLDGTRAMAAEDEPTRPVSAYGRQKAAAENAVVSAGGAVLRLGKVLHPKQATLAGWRRDLISGRAIAPFSDLVMAPVSLGLAVSAIAKLIAARDAAGIFQITANRELSYMEAAYHFAAALGVPRNLVVPTTSEQAGLSLASKPKHATLSDARLRAATGLTAPWPEEAIAQSVGSTALPLSG